jgi:hypothetical protein
MLMRTPHRRRPRNDDRLVSDEPSLAALAAKVDYVISPEHKDYLTSAGAGRLRSDATPCPRGLDFDEVVSWLRAAIVGGDVSAKLEGVFPKYVWARVEGRVYEARLSNSGFGEYKGYPITDDEAPRWLE